ncbi:hypothetical protein L2E82_10152 [Cichorium intybus]|uniref:Uncharacterized protein n=1 Tax=Cichorium intybus TaxID=13427 RepID=A0ACB9GAT0_CICIN|nr:hypothetical protein L2E82_10152 [Cichorium intybus]
MMIKLLGLNAHQHLAGAIASSDLSSEHQAVINILFAVYKKEFIAIGDYVPDASKLDLAKVEHLYKLLERMKRGYSKKELDCVR